jgi:hypothetical protein
MRRWLKIAIGVLAALVVAGLGVFFFILPGYIEGRINGVAEKHPYAV